jgi:hypothetical protein
MVAPTRFGIRLPSSGSTTSLDTTRPCTIFYWLLVASKPSPFAKNASRRGEHWQGHSAKDCSWRFAKTEDLFALCSTLFDSRAERPSHYATIVKQFLAQRKVTMLDHPPYSPDLAPDYYFLFPKVKSHLRGVSLTRSRTPRKPWQVH